MSRMYSISFSNVSVSAAQDFFSVKPATDKPIVVHAIFLSNVGGTADAGDAQEELLGVEIGQGNTTIGSGGTNPTARPLNSVDTAFGPTTNVRVNDTTKVTTGTRLLLHADGFNIRTGWQYIPTPEMRIRHSAADNFLAVQLLAAPADAVSMSGTMIVEEL